MINFADQVKVMANTLVEKVQGTKKLTTNGNPRYTVSLEDLMELGFNRSNLLAAAKTHCVKFTKKENFIIESYNLRSSLIDFLTESKA